MSASARTLATAVLLTWVTIALVVATVALVIVTRQGTEQERAAARDEMSLLRQQFGAEHRPLLVDVLTNAPLPVDIDALYDVDEATGPNSTKRHSGPVIEADFPGRAGREYFDPRRPFVRIDEETIYVSVGLRNVGRGLAMIEVGERGVDGHGLAIIDRQVEIEGYGIGLIDYQRIHREHVPVGETTRIDLIAHYRSDQEDELVDGTSWWLTVPYADFAGQQRTVATIELVLHGDGPQGTWRVGRVDQESIESSPATDVEPSGWTARIRRLLYGAA